jgi:hypothetical protein
MNTTQGLSATIRTAPESIVWRSATMSHIMAFCIDHLNEIPMDMGEW